MMRKTDTVSADERYRLENVLKDLESLTVEEIRQKMDGLHDGHSSRDCVLVEYLAMHGLKARVLPDRVILESGGEPYYLGRNLIRFLAEYDEEKFEALGITCED